jgi:hypothetical protein
MRAKPAVVKGEPRSEVNTNGDFSSKSFSSSSSSRAAGGEPRREVLSERQGVCIRGAAPRLEADPLEIFFCNPTTRLSAQQLIKIVDLDPFFCTGFEGNEIADVYEFGDPSIVAFLIPFGRLMFDYANLDREIAEIVIAATGKHNFNDEMRVTFQIRSRSSSLSI